MINPTENSKNAKWLTVEERIEINREAVETGSEDMKFVNRYLKKDYGVKLVRKGKKVIVEAA